MNWKPIESAPKDGTKILVTGIPRHEKERYYSVVTFDDVLENWRTMDDESYTSEWIFMGCEDLLTHWIEIPKF